MQSQLELMHSFNLIARLLQGNALFRCIDKLTVEIQYVAAFASFDQLRIDGLARKY